MENIISKESIITTSKEQVFCDLAGESVILNFKNGIYYGLDTIGALVWNLIQQSKPVKEICNCILEAYDISLEQCENDLLILLNELNKNGLIEVKNESIEKVLSSSKG